MPIATIRSTFFLQISDPVLSLSAKRHLRKVLFYGLRFLLAVRRVPLWRAEFRVYRPANLRTAATTRLVAKGYRAPLNTSGL